MWSSGFFVWKLSNQMRPVIPVVKNFHYRYVSLLLKSALLGQSRNFGNPAYWPVRASLPTTKEKLIVHCLSSWSHLWCSSARPQPGQEGGQEWRCCWSSRGGTHSLDDVRAVAQHNPETFVAWIRIKIYFTWPVSECDAKIWSTKAMTIFFYMHFYLLVRVGEPPLFCGSGSRQ